ncbi:hypothetical protein RvY_15922 [Ramazzottius varieornatus]|uniref:Copper transport protein n=1 Tax=Ramazzottius varieornatus TaxID=947166 RepID=A0A1D1VY20_RAMVA|nr:hypothetical protein RvY_15922 [Ramazzottius varieornatus]
MDMPMYFNFNMPAFILFRDWAPRRPGELMWSVFGVFIIAIGHEGVKRLRDMVKKWDKRQLDKEAASRTSNGCPCNDVPAPEVWLLKTTLMLFRKFHLITTLLVGIQTTLGYFLMLASMTYNVWVFLAIVLGTLFGYFIFNYATRASALVIPQNNNNENNQP